MATAPRPRHAGLVDTLGVAAFAVLCAVAMVRLAYAAAATPPAALILLAAPLGYLLADFASGFAHWFCDTFFDEESAIIGHLLIHPFREHHRDPLSITRHGFLELNGNNCLAVSPVCAGLLLLNPAGGPLGMFSYATVLCFCLGTVATNQFHRWAHEPTPHRLARLLHRLRLILPPRHHDVHHTPPGTRHFCVTSGWANALMERLRFWEVAGRLLVAAGVPKSAAQQGTPSLGTADLAS